MKVFPNPSQNNIIINGIKDFSYEIFSVKGDKIMDGIYSNQINISNFSSGIYFIKVGDQTIKFVKN